MKVAARPGGARVGQEKRREELIQAAFRLIARHGFEGLRTRDVAAEVGVNIATLHYYFPTKEALIRGVVDHAMGRFRSTLAPHGSPAEQLRNHLRAVRKLVLEEPELGIVMGELGLRSSRDEAMSSLLEEMNDGWLITMRGLLRRAAREGALKPEMDGEGVASLLVLSLSGLTLPTMAKSPLTDQAMRQLERWLGISAAKRKSSKPSVPEE
ncbi:MAG TPA: TetR/AcrR family transcriptional regulator [Candidatus Dormibacteraeota bacterium]|nr:TetR/AcrR family transcriptional regulator [Candidatus Dormibacteraeota bacterium]